MSSRIVDFSETPTVLTVGEYIAGVCVLSFKKKKTKQRKITPHYTHLFPGERVLWGFYRQVSILAYYHTLVTSARKVILQWLFIH